MGFGFQVSPLSQMNMLNVEALDFVRIPSLGGTNFLDALNELRARPARAGIGSESLFKHPG